MLRTCVIWLRFFWPVVPGIVAAIGAGWLLWGLGFWISFALPLAAGAAVWLFFTLTQMAAGLSAR